MNRKYNILLWLVAVLLAISPVVVYYVTLRSFDFAKSSNDFGIFGDYIGGTVGTIVGIISIYLLYVTYTSQVRFARKQDVSTKRQQFESTFFCLLAQQQMLREKLQGQIGNERLQGIAYLTKLKEELSDALSCLNYRQDEISSKNKTMLKYIVNQLYLDFFLPNVSNLGHYFRHLYHILKYVDESNIDDAKSYIDILQAQLSNDELYLLSINGISNFGRKKMFPLLNKYSLLENYNAKNDMLIVKILSIFYSNNKNKYLMMKKKKIIFIGGVYGVGKSTFVNSVKKKCPFVEGLSCSTILNWKNPANKEVENVEDNQNRLLQNLPYFIDLDKSYLLDGHFCLLTTKETIERVPLEVFETINPDMILLLEASGETLRKRLIARDSKEYSLSFINDFLQEEKAYANEVANVLDIPFKICSQDEIDSQIEEISCYLENE